MFLPVSHAISEARNAQSGRKSTKSRIASLLLLCENYWKDDPELAKGLMLIASALSRGATTLDIQGIRTLKAVINGSGYYEDRSW